MNPKEQIMVYCEGCHKQTEHKHIHKTVYDLKDTHMAGSECYKCTNCEYPIYKPEGLAKGLVFVLD